jgi:SAM-dependent methyltransferase
MPYDFGPRDAARFPARCAELVAKHAPAAAEGGAPLSALDVGCAVGGASFELARTFDAVVGLDFSHAFVNAAKRLQARSLCICAAPACQRLCAVPRRIGSCAAPLTHSFALSRCVCAALMQDGERLPCTAAEEGQLSSWFVASAPEGVDAARVAFRTGDACALPPAADGFGPFHAVLASNLLCRYEHTHTTLPTRYLLAWRAGADVSRARRLPDPRAFLSSLPRLLHPGGVAVIVSPYSWLEEYTPQAAWLGGVVRGGADVASAPQLAEAMVHARHGVCLPAGPAPDTYPARTALSCAELCHVLCCAVYPAVPYNRRRWASRWLKSRTCRSSFASTVRDACMHARAHAHTRPRAGSCWHQAHGTHCSDAPRACACACLPAVRPRRCSAQVSVGVQPRDGVAPRRMNTRTGAAWRVNAACPPGERFCFVHAQDRIETHTKGTE